MGRVYTLRSVYGPLDDGIRGAEERIQGWIEFRSKQGIKTDKLQRIVIRSDDGFVERLEWWEVDV